MIERSFLIKAEYLEKAVKEDKTEMLKPILDLSYRLKPVTKLELMETARTINQKLGYELFDDLKYSQLLLDFSRLTRAVQINAVENSK